MPPLRLTTILQSALPDVSRPSRALLSSLACVNGNRLPADAVAAWVGLRNRYQLSRVLRGDRLPPFETLTGWVRVLYWKCKAEETGASLCELARHEHVEPAVAYRLVRRLTGKRWSELRRIDVEVILSRLSGDRPAGLTRMSDVGVRSPTLLPARSFRIGVAGSPAAFPGHPVGVLAARLNTPEAGLGDVATTSARLALLARPRAAAIEVVQLPTLTSLGTIPTGPNPTRIAVTRSGERAYVTSQFGEEVDILDLRAGRQTDAISLAESGGGHPLGAALARDERMLYITTNTDRLYRIDLTNRRMIWTPIRQGSQYVAVHPSGHRVVANGWRTGIVTECDTTTLRVCREFQLGGCVEDLAFSADGDRLFAANLGGWVDVITFKTGARAARVQFGTAACGLALSRDARVLLIGLLNAGRVVMLDATTLRIVAQIDTGGRPRMIANDPGGPGVVVSNENGWLDLVT